MKQKSVYILFLAATILSFILALMYACLDRYDKATFWIVWFFGSLIYNSLTPKQ
jgi:hypothetical protein